MATILTLNRIETGLIPADPFSKQTFCDLRMGGLFKAVLTVPKRINSDDPTEDQRISAQNRLMWAWLTDMSNTTVNELSGNTVDDWHLMMKKRFLARIYERDCNDFAVMMQSVRKVRNEGMKAEALVMWDFIAKELSTTRATVRQFAEYLTCIERFCSEKGIWLRTDVPLCELACVGDYESVNDYAEWVPA